MVQAFARHAVAHVEREHDVEGHLLEAHELDILPDTVVEHLEVSRPESGHRLSVLGHERVDAHRFHPRRERRPLAALGRGWNRGSNHKHQRNGTHSRHGCARLNRRLNSSSQSSAFLAPTTK